MPHVAIREENDSNSHEDEMLVSPVAKHNDARVNFPLERNNNFKHLVDISMQ